MNTPAKHIHADLILERARQDATGETAAGWWQWGTGTAGLWSNCPSPMFNVKYQYRYTMTDKHPSFVPPKPKPKLVDMGKLPVGSAVMVKWLPAGTKLHVMTKLNELGQIMIWNPAAQTRTVKTNELRIAEQKEFTYWGGGACPVPDGLRVALAFRLINPGTVETPSGIRWTHNGHGGDVIGYRILGLADGWTDDPAEAA